MTLSAGTITMRLSAGPPMVGPIPSMAKGRLLAMTYRPSPRFPLACGVPCSSPAPAPSVLTQLAGGALSLWRANTSPRARQPHLNGSGTPVFRMVSLQYGKADLSAPSYFSVRVFGIPTRQLPAAARNNPGFPAPGAIPFTLAHSPGRASGRPQAHFLTYPPPRFRPTPFDLC